MTRALVVFESLFGDARAIAHAIADGLSSTIPTDVVAAAEAPAEVAARRAAARRRRPQPRPVDAAAVHPGRGDQAVRREIADPSRGLHEWLDAVQVVGQDTRAAAFDTRSDHPKLLVKLDHAARTEEKLLRRHGLPIVAPAEHFYVADAKGPLADGEEDRARRWGASLAERLAATLADRPTPPPCASAHPGPQGRVRGRTGPRRPTTRCRSA